MDTQRILVISTGGTIGMQPTSRGYAPAPGSLARQMNAMPEFRHQMMPAWDLIEFDPVLDSSEIGPADWNRMARTIAESSNKYDGFVIIHGTDTMAYTASALAFMLRNLNRPVVLTGSQIPLCELRNDARDNLVTSMLLAAVRDLAEVCICFGGKILRGCRSVKTDAEGLQAFESPRFPSLGRAGRSIHLRRDLLTPALKSGRTPFSPALVTEDVTVGALRIFPGISADFVENILTRPLKGLIIETFGLGNGPVRNIRFMKALEKACMHGTVIVNCSQCLRGQVDQTGYATGSALAEIGIISGRDMTAEAALTKLIWLFSQDPDPQRIKKLMGENLRGELTPPGSALGS